MRQRTVIPTMKSTISPVGFGESSSHIIATGVIAMSEKSAASVTTWHDPPVLYTGEGEVPTADTYIELRTW